MSVRSAGLAVLVFLSAAAPASEAHEAEQTVMCGVLRDRASGRAGDVRLRREQSRVALAAAEEIMVLYDKLWKTRSVPRLEYLGGQRDRDVARVTIRSVERHLERELAALAQFEALCSKGSGVARVDAIREASRLYREADCQMIGLNAEIAGIELAFRKAVVEAYREMRESRVATQQDVIYSRRDLDLARASLSDSNRRATACGRATVASRSGGVPTSEVDALALRLASWELSQVLEDQRSGGNNK